MCGHTIVSERTKGIVVNKLLALLLFSSQALAQSPVMHPITPGADITLTLPSTDDTLMGENSTDTMSNKTVNSWFWWLDSTATYRTAFKAGPQSLDINYVWPLAQATGLTSLTNDGAGNLSWGPPGGVSIGQSVAGGIGGNVLYLDGSGNLAQNVSGAFTYDGYGNFYVNGTIHSPTYIDAPLDLGQIGTGGNSGMAYAQAGGFSFDNQVQTDGSGHLTIDGLAIYNIGTGYRTYLENGSAYQDLYWYLPNSNGSNGYVLTTDGSGNLSWSAGQPGPQGPQGPQGNNGADGRYQGVYYPLADYGSNYISLQYNDSIVMDSYYIHLAGEETGYPYNTNYLYSSDSSNNRGWHPASSIQWYSMSGPNGTWLNGSGYLSYTNGQTLMDSSGNMYTANNNYLVNSSGFLSWTNGNTFMDNSFNLFSDNGTQFTLPTSQGATEAALVNDGSGNTSWSQKAYPTATTSASASCNVSCSGSQTITGGGCANTDTTVALVSSYPASSVSWACNYSAGTGDCTAYAICQ
jgi:hypothetical protein